MHGFFPPSMLLKTTLAINFWVHNAIISKPNSKETSMFFFFFFKALNRFHPAKRSPVIASILKWESDDAQDFRMLFLGTKQYSIYGVLAWRRPVLC